MAAVNEFMHETTPSKFSAVPVYTMDGGRLVVRSGQSLLGVALILAAVGLWIMPGSDLSNDVMLMKLVLSVVAAGIGISLSHNAKTESAPSVEIDMVRREIRLVRSKRDGSNDRKRFKFADLDAAEVDGNHFTLWGRHNAVLAEVDIKDPRLHRSLKGALQDAGKL